MRPPKQMKILKKENVDPDHSSSRPKTKKKRFVTGDEVVRVVKEVFPTATEPFLTLVRTQVFNSTCSTKSRQRWDPRWVLFDDVYLNVTFIMMTICFKFFKFSFSIIQQWLMVYAKSPKAYVQLKASGMLLMPSTRLLTLYKNAVQQGPGVQSKMSEWMVHEAKRAKLPSHGYEGGLLFDEMAIQVH